MEIEDEEFKKLFLSKPRQDCANCRSVDFYLFKTPMDVDITEAVMMQCKKCGHTRLELV